MSEPDRECPLCGGTGRVLRDKPPEQEKCTCVPSKYEDHGGWASITSGSLDPCCPVHWRMALIQNSVVR